MLEFFETSGRNLLAAEAAAGVRHHVALSIVGADRKPDNGYFRAKVTRVRLRLFFEHRVSADVIAVQVFGHGASRHLPALRNLVAIGA